jgi:hypothetical protein
MNPATFTVAGLTKDATVQLAKLAVHEAVCA